MNDEDFFNRTKVLMEKLNKDQQLQDLAERNGLSVKNSIRLNEDTANNTAVAVLSLMLAKENQDPRYRTLTQTGLQKRRLKNEIINSYKSQANQIIKRYQNEK